MTYLKIGEYIEKLGLSYIEVYWEDIKDKI